MMQKLLRKGFNINALRTNGTLRHEEWIELDRLIIETARIRLRAVADLFNAGLVKPANVMKTSVLQWQVMSRTGETNLDMDPQTHGDSEALDFQQRYLPLPIVHAEYQIGARELNISRMNGWTGLDSLMAAQKAQDVAERIENMLVNGESNYTYGQGTIYGYTDFPDRAVVSISDWSDDAVDGETINKEVLEMIQANIDQFSYGPYILYIPRNLQTKFSEDYSDQKGDNTIRERVLENEGLQRIQVLDTLEEGNVLLVQMTSDKVQIVNAMPFTNIEWNTKGGFTSHYRVMASMIPRLLSDRDGNSGIVHGIVASPSPS